PKSVLYGAGRMPCPVRGIGTFAIFEPTTGQGIRPAPYSTDLGVNPFTYGDITNGAQISQPHGIGFLWCNMLWEMTWMLIDRYGYDPDLVNGTGGNNIAMQLVTEGMKLQPCGPGFEDGRDAILLADQNLYAGANQCLIWSAFAKRGLGFSASQGSANSRNDGSQAFDLPPGCSFFPVEWLGITATPLEKEIQVQWGVSSELDNRGFEVQRRIAGEEEFETISYVDSRGNSTFERSYDILDGDVQPNIDYIYRVKQIDQNGEFSFSLTATARLESGLANVNMFPNPTNGQLNIEFSQLPGTDVEVHVMNLLGQEMHVARFAQELTNKPLSMDVSDLPAGTYMVKIVVADESVIQKLVVR
ncbi:MAG: M36 family metallopeptidase, partial [Bacteroidota bacterium]